MVVLVGSFLNEQNVFCDIRQFSSILPKLVPKLGTTALRYKNGNGKAVTSL